MRSLCLIASALLIALLAPAQPDSTVFDDLLFDALQGNMAPVVRALDTLEDAHLKKGQVRMKSVLLHRFRKQDERYDFRTTDNSVAALMRIYHTYWRNALLDTAAWKTQNSLLVANVSAHLLKHASRNDTLTAIYLAGHWSELLETHLKEHGYYAAVGKTGQFYDLLLHTVETEMRYPVTTPEDTLQVKVVFMDSVISNGWEGYATCDTYYPGGWATSDALYCARSSYDLKSENFTVSYLKHEGKHFADYKRFPQLESADLEYRAKLVELGAANSTMYSLIQFFLRNGAYDENNGHAFANFCVMRDLSRSLFGKDLEEDMTAWKALPLEKIQAASTTLLLKNTKDMEAAGASTVKNFIR